MKKNINCQFDLYLESTHREFKEISPGSKIVTQPGQLRDSKIQERLQVK